eukprot:TRINITY_DN11983_c0_g1_i3.p1 TRINITY_DN11983_c0_g1~~TRINITY_DN11983_c0_g1_i3.p1  ORF type:complete len:188 (-),score=28.50 TRINITY_DN11983_c0_g1_i3:212-697(-)
MAPQTPSRSASLPGLGPRSSASGGSRLRTPAGGSALPQSQHSHRSASSQQLRPPSTRKAAVKLDLEDDDDPWRSKKPATGAFPGMVTADPTAKHWASSTHNALAVVWSRRDLIKKEEAMSASEALQKLGARVVKQAASPRHGRSSSEPLPWATQYDLRGRW